MTNHVSASLVNRDDLTRCMADVQAQIDGLQCNHPLDAEMRRKLELLLGVLHRKAFGEPGT
jgi:hypothetical protein